MSARVLILLDTASTWSRGVLRGFASYAHQQGWSVLHYHPGVDVEWLVTKLQPHAAVCGPHVGNIWPKPLEHCVSVAANCDLSDQGVASVCVDEAAVGQMALKHLSERGLKDLSTFRFDAQPFAVRREQAFVESAHHSGLRVVPGWSRQHEDPTVIEAWIRALPKPCGIFACCDPWGRVVSRYAQSAGARIPEDVALLGVDNDSIECELITPPLSSIAIPWRALGENVAALVAKGLSNVDIRGQKVVIPPLDVVTRRSTDIFAISDPLVSAAVHWIQQNSQSQVSVPKVASAVASTRQRLERRFRGVLGRTVAQEVRRTRVERAKQLLATTELVLPDIATQAGFTNASLLSEAFKKELGMSPGRYRRGVRRIEETGD